MSTRVKDEYRKIMADPEINARSVAQEGFRPQASQRIAEPSSLRGLGFRYQVSGNTVPDITGFSGGTSLARWLNLHDLRCQVSGSLRTVLPSIANTDFPNRTRRRKSRSPKPNPGHATTSFYLMPET
jgi:hypothetical protein